MLIHSLFYTSSFLLGDGRLTSTKESEGSGQTSQLSPPRNELHVSNILTKENEWHQQNVNVITKIILHRRQNFKIIDDFLNQYFLFKDCIYLFDIPDQIILKKAWLSDNEIVLANRLSKWYYSRGNFFLISSIEIECLNRHGITENYDNEFDKKRRRCPKIYDLFSREYTETNLQRQDLKSSEIYVEWEHGSNLLTRLLQKEGEGMNSSMIGLNLNQNKTHWIFFLGIDYYKFNKEKDNEVNNLRIYFFDSYNNCQEPNSVRNLKNEKSHYKFSAICRLMKLILLFKRYQGKESDSFVVENSTTLKIKRDLYNRMESMEDFLVHVKVTKQSDTYTCGFHIIRFFDEVLRIQKNLFSKNKFSRENFEMEIVKSKQLKLPNEQNDILKSELLEYFLNINYTIGLLTNCLKLQLFNLNDNITDAASVTCDIMDEYKKWELKKNKTNKHVRNLRRRQEKNESPRGRAYLAISDEFKRSLIQLKSSRIPPSCQCFTAFPLKEIKKLKQNDILDIHDFDWNMVSKLRWTCPRTNRTGRGSCYDKQSISKANPVFEKTKIAQIIKIWKPETNVNFVHKEYDVDFWYKELLLKRLSVGCNLEGIIIPDGGSCSESVTTLILVNENETSTYGKYINNLRKLMRIQPYAFQKNFNKVLKNLRLSYAESLSCNYEPNVQELFNIRTDEADSNALYCSSVLWNMYKIIQSQDKSCRNYLLQDCVRKFIALTPSQVGKVGCMYGTDDFLYWFQCVFNIRIFTINIQHFGNQTCTTKTFVRDYAYNSGEQCYDDEYSNDKYFDFNNKNNIIPYGIAIILMEGTHFDRVFKLHSSKSPIIPAGSDGINFLLPFLKISDSLWASLEIGEIEKHNSKIISSDKMDANNELNFWFDHNYAMENINDKSKADYELGYSDFIKRFISENKLSGSYPGIPCCAIRFPPKFLAYYIYFLVIQEKTSLKTLLANAEAYAIDLEDEDITNKYTVLLEEFINKQQQKYPRIPDFFSELSFNDAISDTLKLYKDRNHSLMRKSYDNKNKNKVFTERITFPRSKMIMGIKRANESSRKQQREKTKNLITSNANKRSLNNSSNITDLNNASSQPFKKRQTESTNDEFINKGSSSIIGTKRSMDTEPLRDADRSKKINKTRQASTKTPLPHESSSTHTSNESPHKTAPPNTNNADETKTHEVLVGSNRSVPTTTRPASNETPLPNESSSMHEYQSQTTNDIVLSSRPASNETPLPHESSSTHENQFQTLNCLEQSSHSNRNDNSESPRKTVPPNINNEDEIETMKVVEANTSVTTTSHPASTNTPLPNEKNQSQTTNGIELSSLSNGNDNSESPHKTAPPNTNDAHESSSTHTSNESPDITIPQKTNNEDESETHEVVGSNHSLATTTHPASNEMPLPHESSSSHENLSQTLNGLEQSSRSNGNDNSESPCKTAPPNINNEDEIETQKVVEANTSVTTTSHPASTNTPLPNERNQSQTTNGIKLSSRSNGNDNSESPHKIAPPNTDPTTSHPASNKTHLPNENSSTHENQFQTMNGVEQSLRSNRNDNSLVPNLTPLSEESSSTDENQSQTTTGVDPSSLINGDDNSDPAKGSSDSPSISDVSVESVNKQQVVSSNSNQNDAKSLHHNVPSFGKELRMTNNSKDESTEDDESSSSTGNEDDEASLVSERNNQEIQVELSKYNWLFEKQLKIDDTCHGICDSFSEHPVRKGPLRHFTFTKTGKISNSATNDFKQLILCSKKVWITGKPLDNTYEGMYGFIPQRHYPLVKKYTTIEPEGNYPYIWQCLKTTTSEEYTKARSLAYLKGSDEQSQALTNMSLIAWDYLNSFCGKNNGVRWCHEISEFISSHYGFLDRGELSIEYDFVASNHKLIGNTPFTSCHVCYWMNIANKVDIIRNYEDAIACVLLCFGPSNNDSENVPYVKLNTGDGWSSPVKLGSDKLFAYSPKSCRLKFSGVPKNYLLLSFYIDISSVEKIESLNKSSKSKKRGTDWYSICLSESNKEIQVDRVPRRRRRMRKGPLQSCASVSMGYIDLLTSEKQEGSMRSCLQDAFINAGHLFGINISKELLSQVPPKRTKNTLLRAILGSPVIKENFIFPRVQHFTREKGGNEWVLLHHHLGTGVYIVWCTVESTKKIQESHAFVYNSDFSEWNGERYYGAIIDNRVNSCYRAFSQKDLIDVQSARNSLSSYFCGITRINGWLKIVGKIKSNTYPVKEAIK